MVEEGKRGRVEQGQGRLKRQPDEGKRKVGDGGSR